ncbi:MAG TPA: hypothetical protein VKT32_02325, partial [Chthonomonadaceae bacterium]|nr:hypothetical protein [Chthonomonadaceae bacterium]
ENWSGQERAIPKLALYRLWTGDSPADMENITEASGDGDWGVVNDTFFLAEGDSSALAPIFARARKPGTPILRGATGHTTLRVHDRRVPARIVHALETLPE